VYGVHDYDAMLADEVRSGAYVGAIARAVRPGDVVIEIGTGVGFFAVVAARAGARHVYAIELNPAIALGPEIAAANDCADRITFVRGHSAHVTLPERGDVLIEDLRGVLPLAGDHIPSVVDARARHLRPGATIVPVRDTLWAAPCEAPASFRADHVKAGPAPFGIDRRVVDARVREHWHSARLTAEQLFAPPAQWGTIDFATVTSPDVAGRAEWTVQRAGSLEGVCVWFDTDLGFGCGYSNAPGCTPTVHGQGLLPFARALDVGAGDRLVTEIRAKLVEEDYVFAWDTTFEPVEGSGRAGARFRQSNLAEVSAALEELHLWRADRRPALGARAALLHELVALADGAHSLREIAATLHRAHPGAFAEEAAALRFVSRSLAALEGEERRPPSR